MGVFTEIIRSEFRHRVIFTRGALRVDNPVLARVFAREGDGPARVLAVVDRGVARAHAGLLRSIAEYFSAHGKRMKLVAPPLLVPGGEAAKNDWRQVEKLWAAMECHGLSRQSCVLAIGGGAALDLAGFAAATAHRGVRLVRMPTTSLSQADGGVGVKCAVNFFGKKNWVGAFAVPAAVVNDLDFLRALPPVARRGGVVEAFKVGLIRHAGLADYIAQRAAALARGERGPLERVIQASARLHLRHIARGGDPFEQGAARPLDFGHWAAHKLEQLSDFRLAHGDAVAAGMALDIRYSEACGWLDARAARRALAVIEKLGCDTGDGKNIPLVRRLLALRDARGRPAALAGLEEFRQHLGGALTLTLLRAWGRGEETHTLDVRRMRSIIESIAK